MGKVEFKNPELKSVDQLVLVHDGEKIPALVSQWQHLNLLSLRNSLLLQSARWIEPRNVAKYVPFKLKNGKMHESFDFDEDEWLLEVKRFNNDLEWMLGMNFHQ